MALHLVRFNFILHSSEIGFLEIQLQVSYKSSVHAYSVGSLLQVFCACTFSWKSLISLLNPQTQLEISYKSSDAANSAGSLLNDFCACTFSWTSLTIFSTCEFSCNSLTSLLYLQNQLEVSHNLQYLRIQLEVCYKSSDSVNSFGSPLHLQFSAQYFFPVPFSCLQWEIKYYSYACGDRLPSPAVRHR
jgi:hypothetical protein